MQKSILYLNGRIEIFKYAICFFYSRLWSAKFEFLFKMGVCIPP